MKNSGGIKIIMIAALALMILAGTGAAVSLSNSGGGTWKYQREISIKENSGTMLTDYQVLIELKGADFPNEAQSNGADVRFTDSSGDGLNYWIESWNYAGKNAKIWVKIPSISGGTTTIIRIYYGNLNAKSSSNGDATFDFFDDFSGDLSKWTTVEGPSPVIENGEVSIIDDGKTQSIIRSTLFQTKNGVIETKIKVLSTSSAAHWIVYGRWTSTSSFEGFGGRGVINDFYIYDGSLKGSVSWNTNALNTWFLFQAKMNEGKLEWSVYDTSGTFLKTTTAVSTKGTGYVGITSWKESHTHYDDFRVRKYASFEPTISLAPPKSSSLSITKSAPPIPFASSRNPRSKS